MLRRPPVLMGFNGDLMGFNRIHSMEYIIITSGYVKIAIENGNL